MPIVNSNKQAVATYVALLRCTNVVAGHVGTAIKQHKLTISQFGVLEALYHHEQLTHKDLSEKLLRVQGNMTLVVDNLEKAGLIQRLMNKQDRRSSYVSLTNKGAKLMKKVLPGHYEVIAEAMGGLTTMELRDLKKLCTRLGKYQGGE